MGTRLMLFNIPEAATPSGHQSARTPSSLSRAAQLGVLFHGYRPPDWKALDLPTAGPYLAVRTLNSSTLGMKLAGDELEPGEVRYRLMRLIEERSRLMQREAAQGTYAQWPRALFPVGFGEPGKPG